MDIVKVKETINWKILTKIKEVQSYLEFGNFYQRFIKNFLSICQLLYNLTRKSKTCEWTDKCQKIACNHMCIKRMETLPKRITTSC